MRMDEELAARLDALAAAWAASRSEVVRRAVLLAAWAGDTVPTLQKVPTPPDELAGGTWCCRSPNQPRGATREAPTREGEGLSHAFGDLLKRPRWTPTPKASRGS